MSGVVQVASQSLAIATQMLIRTRLYSVRTSWSVMESAIMHVASLKVHHYHITGKQVCKIC